MNLNNKLRERINIKDVKEILEYIEDNEIGMKKLYTLIFDTNTLISFQALWICSHLPEQGHQWLYKKQDILINEVLKCPHSGKRRLLLNLLISQPAPNPPRVDLLDFCLERMILKSEPPGVQVLCMKLAFNICITIPELLQELKIILDIMQPELLPPSMKSARKSLLKAIQKQKIN